MREFSSCARIRLHDCSEMLETMHENDVFDMFLVFSNVVHILRVIPATLCSAEQSFSTLGRLKTYLRSTMGNNMSVTPHSLTLKGHMPLCSQQ